MSNPNEISGATSCEAARLDDFDIDQVELTVRPRASESLTLPLPKTVVASLKRVMLKRSMASIETLIRFYIGQGLRQDLSQLSSERMTEATTQVLARRLGSKEAAAEAMEEIRQAIAKGNEP